MLEKFIKRIVLILFFLLSLRPIMAIENPYLSLDEMLSRSLMKDTQIVILGDEDHYNQNIKDLFFKLVPRFNDYDKNFNCIFLEHDKRYQKSIDAYFRGASFSSSIGRERIRLGKINSQPRVELKSYLRDNFLKSLKGKVEVFAYDFAFEGEVARVLVEAYSEIYTKRTPTVEDLYNFKEIGFVLRNELMAQNIDKFIRGNNCKRSVVITGDGHMMKNLGPTFPEGEIETLADHLSKFNYKLQYYNLRSANCNRSSHRICEVLTSEDFELGSGVLNKVPGVHAGMFVTK